VKRRGGRDLFRSSGGTLLLPKEKAAVLKSGEKKRIRTKLRRKELYGEGTPFSGSPKGRRRKPKLYLRRNNNLSRHQEKTSCTGRGGSFTLFEEEKTYPLKKERGRHTSKASIRRRGRETSSFPEGRGPCPRKREKKFEKT